MEEAQGRVSPPLAKGAYNIDFDALDDSFNPFQTKKDIRNSPPLVRKDPSSQVETVEAVQTAMGDRTQDGNNLLTEGSEVSDSKKRKSKSPASKRASVVKEDANIQDAKDSQAAVDDLEVAASAIAEKPVRIKKVGKKPRSRPVSKNLEGEGQAIPDKPPSCEQSESSTAVDPASSTETLLPSQPAGTVSDSAAVEETTLSEKVLPQPDNTPQQPVKISEKIPEESTVILPKKSASEKPSSLSEEGVESPSRKEKSSGKVRKAKTKVKKSSSSSRVAVAGDGVDEVAAATTTENEKRSRSSSAINSQREAVNPPAVVAESNVQKSKHPAARVLEQQVQGSQPSQPEAKGNLPNELEDDFYDAFDSSPPVMSMMNQTQSYNDLNDSCMLFQSHDDLGRLSWSQEESSLLDEGAGEAAFAEDLTLGDSDMADGHRTESVVKLVQVLKYSQSDWNKLRQELELNFQAQLLAKEREWSAKLADRDNRLSTWEETNKKLRQTNEDMRTVMAEFEKTIEQLQSEKEKTSNASQQSLQDVVKERDQALEDLQSVETAFSDLHRRYEKTKGVVDGFKQNEDMLKKCVQDLQNKLKKAEQKVQLVKEQAEEKLEKATEEIEKTQRTSASEIAKLEAALRKAELQAQGLETSLEQKIKENKELAAICDELIAKVQ